MTPLHVLFILACCAAGWWLWTKTRNPSQPAARAKLSETQVMNLLGIQSHHDAELGLFTRNGDTWTVSTECDLPFQSDVKILFTCDATGAAFPGRFPASIRFVNENFAEIWNRLAAELNGVLERAAVRTPDHFSLDNAACHFDSLSAGNVGEWRMGLKVRGMKGCLTARFNNTTLLEAWHRTTEDETGLQLSLRKPPPRRLPRDGALLAADAIAQGRLLERSYEMVGWVPLSRELFSTDILSITANFDGQKSTKSSKAEVKRRVQTALALLETCLPAIEAELDRYVAEAPSLSRETFRATLHAPGLLFDACDMAQNPDRWSFTLEGDVIAHHFEFDGPRLVEAWRAS